MPCENRVSEGSKERPVGVQGGLPAEELESDQTRNGPVTVVPQEPWE